MSKLENVVGELSRDDIQGELWVNGSFLTQKINPQDVDAVLCLKSDFVDNASISQRARIDWFAGNLKNSHLCDTYVFVDFPSSDPRYRGGFLARQYWEKQFGFSRGDQPKGIAVVMLPLA